MIIDRNLLLRTISGVLYILLLSSTLMFAGVYSIWLFVALGCFACYEFLRNECKKTWEIFPVLVAFLLMVFSLFNRYYNIFPQLNNWAYPLMTIVFIVFLIYLWRAGYKASSIMRLICGGGYILIGLGLLWSIGYDPSNARMFKGEQVLFIFILIWSSDTFAYLSGKRFGKRKLAPKISPGKTIEGVIGGLIATLFLAAWLGPEICEFNIESSSIIAMLVVLSGTIGDLIESAWKRFHGLKDSGKILPGHGGFLDRLDSAFLAGPCVYFFMQFWPV